MAFLRPVPQWTGFSIVPDAGIRIYLSSLNGVDFPKRLAGLQLQLSVLPMMAPPVFSGQPPPVATAPPALHAGEPVVPIKPGFGQRTGSIGAFIEGPDGKRWLLSANHVLAHNGRVLPFGESHGIFAGNARRLVSRDVKFEPLLAESRGASPCDAAVAPLEPAVELAPALYPGFWNLTDGTPIRPTEGTVVRFRNFAGIEKEARVVDSGHSRFRVKMNVGSVDVCVFHEHILIHGENNLVVGGDSGTLVVADVPGGARPVGLIVAKPIAGSANQALVCPLGIILTRPRIENEIGIVSGIMTNR